jgi:hypothetical protein
MFLSYVSNLLVYNIPTIFSPYVLTNWFSSNWFTYRSFLTKRTQLMKSVINVQMKLLHVHLLETRKAPSIVFRFRLLSNRWLSSLRLVSDNIVRELVNGIHDRYDYSEFPLSIMSSSSMLGRQYQIPLSHSLCNVIILKVCF